MRRFDKEKRERDAKVEQRKAELAALQRAMKRSRGDFDEEDLEDFEDDELLDDDLDHHDKMGAEDATENGEEEDEMDDGAGVC